MTIPKDGPEAALPDLEFIRIKDSGGSRSGIDRRQTPGETTAPKAGPAETAAEALTGGPASIAVGPTTGGLAAASGRARLSNGENYFAKNRGVNNLNPPGRKASAGR